MTSPVAHQNCKAEGGVRSQDALEYLMTLFPKDGLKALPHSKSVSVTAPTLGAEFEGVVLHLPGKPKTVYIDGKNAASVSLRERYVFTCLTVAHPFVGRIMCGHLHTNFDLVLMYSFLMCSVVALLDLAADNLDCSALVIVLERSAPNLGELLHSLMYVGGSVVTKPPFTVDPAFIFVGMDI
jgi:hypothetical protein